MHKIINHQPKPDIRFRRDGRIEILTRAARRICLGRGSAIAFFTDDDSNLYLRKVEPDEGMLPTSVHGASFLRYFSAATCKGVLSLPDIPEGTQVAGFRIGEPDDGMSYPVITRRML